MAERRKTPDILADLLGATAPVTPGVTRGVPAGDDSARNTEIFSDSPSATPKISGLPVKQQHRKPEKQQNGKMVKQAVAKREAVKTVTQQKPVAQQSQVAAPGDFHSATRAGFGEGAADDEGGETESKIKVTFYLSEDAVELLEDAQRTLRRLARGQGKNGAPKSLTSKSALLEEALRLACHDIESNGLNSQLARKMF